MGSCGLQEALVLSNKTIPLAASIVIACGAVALADDVQVTASALNIRSGPSSGYRVLGTVTRGTRLLRLGSSGNWTKVRYRGATGYAYSRYLNRISTGGNNGGNSGGNTSNAVTRYVSASSLNVRTGPSTRYRALGRLPYGQAVSVLGSSGVWAQINYGGRAAYVHGSYLTGNRPSTGGNNSGGNNSGGYASSGRRSRAGFIQLANSGPGFYGYYASSKRWGRPALVYGIERAARRFKAANPSAPRLGVGDISLQNGGDISGHASHERGVDADFRPIRNDRREGRTTRFQSTYSRTYTDRVIQLIRSETRVHLIFFNDLNIRGVQRWPNHDNHFHVRIR
jgi:uncharacterized protein YraI